jgi:hypothetical protein
MGSKSTIIAAPSSAIHPILAFGGTQINFIIIEQYGHQSKLGAVIDSHIKTLKASFLKSGRRFFFLEGYSIDQNATSSRVNPEELACFMQRISLI